MNNEAMKGVLNDLFSHLERLETQSEAILQFLKEKKRVTDKQLAPYLEQAANASNVKWRAARVRIDHLLSPEHPEEEIKLGKPPELHEDSTREGSSDEKQKASTDKEDKPIEPVEETKRTESGDQKQIESSDSKGQRAKLDDQTKAAPAEAAQARPANAKTDKPETKSEVERKEAGHAAQDRHEQKSDSVRHPTEVTEPLARQEGAEPAAQLKSDKTDSEKEAA
jgi:hypothetical protein